MRASSAASRNRWQSARMVLQLQHDLPQLGQRAMHAYTRREWRTVQHFTKLLVGQVVEAPENQRLARRLGQLPQCVLEQLQSRIVGLILRPVRSSIWCALALGAVDV